MRPSQSPGRSGRKISRLHVLLVALIDGDLCDPGTVQSLSCLVAAIAAAGCGFDGAPAADGAARDAAPSADRIADASTTFCDGTLVCFSFDGSLATPLASAGSAPLSADHTTTPTTGPMGTAALFTAESRMKIPPNDSALPIVSAELWLRVDQHIGGERLGLMDADATSSAASFFYYNDQRLRFELGSQLFVPFQIETARWYYLAQVCDGGTLRVYIDGVARPETGACQPGDARPYGLQIGANNNQGNGDQSLIGALDGLRLWSSALTPAQICAASTRMDC